MENIYTQSKVLLFHLDDSIAAPKCVRSPLAVTGCRLFGNVEESDSCHRKVGEFKTLGFKIIDFSDMDFRSIDPRSRFLGKAIDL